MVRLLPLRQDRAGWCSLPHDNQRDSKDSMGELFDDPSEVERLSHAYHSCWKEMEVWQLLVE